MTVTEPSQHASPAGSPPAADATECRRPSSSRPKEEPEAVPPTPRPLEKDAISGPSSPSPQEAGNTRAFDSPVSATTSPDRTTTTRFTVSFASCPTSLGPRTRSQSFVSNGDLASTNSSTTTTHHPIEDEAWRKRQLEAIQFERAQRLRRFVEHNEATVVSSVPLEVRLRALLEEGRRHERRCALRAARDAGEPPRLRDERLRCIDAAYFNLLGDVRRRCAIISSHRPDSQQQFNLGSEAIGCYSSMLPWSEGVITAEPPDSPPASYCTPKVPDDSHGASSAFSPTARRRGGAQSQQDAQQESSSPHKKKCTGPPPGLKPLGSTARPSSAPSLPASHAFAADGVSHNSSSSSSSTDSDQRELPAGARRAATPDPQLAYRWAIPQRLALDSRKLTAVTNARRKRLQAIVGGRQPLM